MCSIMGYCGSGADFAAFQRGFDRTLSRGPDDTRVVDVGKGLLGFHRLSIMGLDSTGMQPFQLGSSFAVCNGELYGFEAMRAQLEEKGYTFRSGSDCEILLPLYKEYGTGMFRDVVRLHVVANSNGAEDQAVKLLVRDAVLEEAARWYQGAGSMEEASSQLCTHLQSIAGAARQVLGEQGVGYSATAQMTE